MAMRENPSRAWIAEQVEVQPDVEPARLRGDPCKEVGVVWEADAAQVRVVLGRRLDVALDRRRLRPPGQGQVEDLSRTLEIGVGAFVEAEIEHVEHVRRPGIESLAPGSRDPRRPALSVPPGRRRSGVEAVALDVDPARQVGSIIKPDADLAT